MKNTITSLLLVFTGIISAGAQTAIHSSTGASHKYPFSIYKKIHGTAHHNNDAARAAAPTNLISVLVKGDVASITDEVKSLGGVFKFKAGDIACVRIPVNKIDELAANDYVQRIEGSDRKIQTLNDQMVLNNNVYLVQQGVDLPQAYNGEGVCVGIIDEGIDFNHKDLRDAAGNTRIKWLWDQRLGLDTNYTPQPYDYGQNFDSTQINNLEAGAVVDHDYSHGTCATGIAAGNGFALNNYRGVAPNADIVFVAVNTETSDDDFLTAMVDAVQYVFDKADALHEPCAINISLGTYFGSHDGLDLQAQAISNLVSEKNGRFISCAAGNEGAAPIHLQTNVTPDSSFTWFGGYSTTQQLYFDLWADSANLPNVQWMVGVDQSSPAYQFLGGTGFKPITSIMGYDTMTVFANGNPLGFVETYLDYSNGSYEFQCEITPDTANYLWRFMTTGTGAFDAWSYDLVPGPLPDSSAFPQITKYKLPDTDQTIVSSFTCSPKVITVGSYINRNHYSDVNLNPEWDTMPNNGGVHLVVGSLVNSSSRGPTRDGRIKPEITATGMWLLSCAAAYDLQGTIAVAPWAVAAGGQHRLASGTSFASPVVAGTAALYLQKNPNATYQEVKDAITGCPKTDQFTGTSLPNNMWGYGKIDSYAAIKGCTTGISEQRPPNAYLENYPNPFAEQTTIHYDLSYIDTPHSGQASITITDALGRKVRSIILTQEDGDIVVSKNEMQSGVYFYSLTLDGKVIRTNKLIVM